jgi:hypothetical protein
MVYIPGDGKSILIGKDRILGMGDAAILSDELISVINRKGLFYLFQAQTGSQVGRITQNWISSADLELTGHLQAEWNLFRCALINNGVFMQEKPDSLKWTGGKSTGMISVKNIYLAAENMKTNFHLGGWRRAMWEWNVPLKIKLFTWLLVENKNFPGRTSNEEVFVDQGCVSSVN